MLDLKGDDLPSIFHQTLNFVVARGLLSTNKRDEVEAALVAREAEAPTALGQGFAVPHAFAEFITQPVVVFLRLARPLNLGAPDDVPTRFLFVLLGPPGREAEHLDTLAQIVRLMLDDDFRYWAGICRASRNWRPSTLRHDAHARGLDTPCGQDARGAPLDPDEQPQQGGYYGQTVKMQAIGRRNWLFVASHTGGRRAAILYSLIASCKANQVEPWAYLYDVFSRLPTLPPDQPDVLDELLPDRWLAAHPQHRWRIDDLRRSERQRRSTFRPRRKRPTELRWTPIVGQV